MSGRSLEDELPEARLCGRPAPEKLIGGSTMFFLQRPGG